MTTDRGLGLNELMIINPGVGDGGVFLGDDGVLYRIRKLTDPSAARRPRTRVAQGSVFGDGFVYRARNCGCEPETRR